MDFWEQRECKSLYQARFCMSWSIHSWNFSSLLPPILQYHNSKPVLLHGSVKGYSEPSLSNLPRGVDKNLGTIFVYKFTRNDFCSKQSFRNIDSSRLFAKKKRMVKKPCSYLLPSKKTRNGQQFLVHWSVEALRVGWSTESGSVARLWTFPKGG